jgi:hypothetical protein
MKLKLSLQLRIIPWRHLESAHINDLKDLMEMSSKLQAQAAFTCGICTCWIESLMCLDILDTGEKEIFTVPARN